MNQDFFKYLQREMKENEITDKSYLGIAPYGNMLDGQSKCNKNGKSKKGAFSLTNGTSKKRKKVKKGENLMTNVIDKSH